MDTVRDTSACGLPLSEFGKWLSENQPTGEFKPHVYYHKIMNQLVVMLADVSCYSDQIHPGLIVLRAVDDKRVVGVEVASLREDDWRLVPADNAHS